MPIHRLEISEFSAFADVKIDWSPGLNVLIGENGTGKSHLMKLMYVLLKTYERYPEMLNGEGGRMLLSKLEEKLRRVFCPDEGQLGRLVHRRRGRNKAAVRLVHDNKAFISFALSTLGDISNLQMSTAATPKAIFVPSREALAMFEGFIAAYNERELSFDETYFDLCVALSARPLRGPRGKLAARLIKPIEEILHGRVIQDRGRFYLQSLTGEGNIEAHLMAEGFRKLASLAQLIANGMILQNGVFFWDEPEANLNPKLVTKVAEVLRSLAAAGVQVFVASHDFLLTHELSLAVEYKTAPIVPTAFYAFSREGGEAVSVERGDTLADLAHNPILAEFAAYYGREVALFAGDSRTGGPGRA